VNPADVSMKDKFEPKKSLSSGEAHKLSAEDPANISSITHWYRLEDSASQKLERFLLQS
jgi:hypothetical protein